MSGGPAAEELLVPTTQILAGLPIRAQVWLGEAACRKGAKHRAQDCRPGVTRTQVQILGLLPLSGYVNFLWLLSQINTNLVAKTAEIFFSPCSGAQKSEVSITGLKSSCVGRATLPPEAQGQNLFPASSSLCWLLAFLACGCISNLQVQHLQISAVFTSSNLPLPLSYKNIVIDL